MGCPPFHSVFDDIVSESIWRMVKLAKDHPDAELPLYYMAAKWGAIDGIRTAFGKLNEVPGAEPTPRRPVFTRNLAPTSGLDFGVNETLNALNWVPTEKRPDAVATLKVLLRMYPPTSFDGGLKVAGILLDIAGGLTRQAAGERAGVNASRVSQIVASYVQRVRRANPTICRATHTYDLDRDSIEVLMTEPWS